MAKTYDPELRAAICRAMGVPDPENVRRIVLDVESGQATRIYVERFGDDEALIRDLTPLLMAGTPIGEPVPCPDGSAPGNCMPCAGIGEHAQTREPVADACPACGEPHA